MHRIARLLSTASVASMLAAGVLGGFVMQFVGPELAMGFAIWSARTTEPSRPDVPFPWWALAGLLVLTVGGLYIQGLEPTTRNRKQLARVGSLVAWAAATAVALLPWLHLHSLWSAT